MSNFICMIRIATDLPSFKKCSTLLYVFVMIMLCCKRDYGTIVKRKSYTRTCSRPLAHVGSMFRNLLFKDKGCKSIGVVLNGVSDNNKLVG